MRPPQRVSQVREEAIALRLAGKSVREIRDTLGPVGKRTLSAALAGTPPAEWTHRPNAKDDLREQARALRTQGLSYNEIVAQLGVAKSEDYHGCLRIDVRRSAVLYRKIEGWAFAAMAAQTLSVA
jgi:hypothetical protein